LVVLSLFPFGRFPLGLVPELSLDRLVSHPCRPRHTLFFSPPPLCPFSLRPPTPLPSFFSNYPALFGFYGLTSAFFDVLKTLRGPMIIPTPFCSKGLPRSFFTSPARIACLAYPNFLLSGGPPPTSNVFFFVFWRFLSDPFCHAVVRNPLSGCICITTALCLIGLDAPLPPPPFAQPWLFDYPLTCFCTCTFSKSSVFGFFRLPQDLFLWSSFLP